ncbi:Card1-like endonuclease domain-containing protein [Rhodoferax sp.]|uniref:Card1-like endonuclease domain-containing protein n=1 Tax=Rhodoferax sp. TaxID=50421 RepID=UPI00274990EF|nr:DUF1887 family CARF protein [Rhodoferax sp.]
MTPYDTHLCLVSAQATPNLLPVLDETWRPRRVVLACSAQMKAAAIALRAVIQTKGAGIAVDTLDLPNAYDYAALSDAFLDYLAEHANENIALNVTGGTKLMAVAAQEVFRSEGKPVFYVNVENDEVLVIGEKAVSQPLLAKLKVHEMLRAHGYTVTTQEHPQVTRELRDLTARLIDHVASAGRALGALNALARAARDNNLRVELNRDQSSLALGDIVALFVDAGLLRQQGDMLIFKDEESRLFANGGWLESHVYEALQSLRSQHEALSDVATGVRVGFGGADPRSTARARDKNEIDVAFLYRNTLHLIECKTANLAQVGHGDDSKATEAIYKMESLLKLGGLRTKGMVVDYRGELARSEANQKRAAEAGIAIVSGAQLKDLKGAIGRMWLAKGV